LLAFAKNIAHSRCGISKVGWAILFERSAKSDLRAKIFQIRNFRLRKSDFTVSGLGLPIRNFVVIFLK